MIAFLDASALIYLIEGREPFAGTARAALQDLARHTGWGFVSSRTDRPASEALLALWTRLAPEAPR